MNLSKTSVYDAQTVKMKPHYKISKSSMSVNNQLSALTSSASSQSCGVTIKCN